MVLHLDFDQTQTFSGVGICTNIVKVRQQPIINSVFNELH